MNDFFLYKGPGIPDELFIRGEVPMTREEIRVISLAKARLGPGQVVWDVGSGTGSIAVEAALLAPGGQVWAVERSAGGCRLIRENCSRFDVPEVRVVQGEAPGALADLPRPDRVIVGGSGGKLREILDLIREKMLPGGRLVINAVTLETLTGTLDFLRAGCQCEIVQVAVSKSLQLGSSRVMKPYHPVYIISAWGWGDDVGG